MTSTTAVQNEIKRFLRSSDPEVLCVVGDWGVGKTYNWQANLDQMRAERSIGLSRYSYVSLFGINSLESMKSAMFENLEFLVPEGQSTMERMTFNANRAFTAAKRFGDVASAAPVVGNAIAKLQPHLFSTIRNQIICVDDLERRGGGLDVKDIFGLISFLREQRGCKIALLLNESKLDEEVGAKQFADYFEKVIDTKVIFAPTAAEAVAIAVTGKDDTSKLIAHYCIKLGISNIRVMKKIERLVGMVIPLVEELDPNIARQVVHSVVMFGWCKFDAGASPPSFEYLKANRMSRYVDRTQGKKATAEEVRWDTIISSYEFENLDEFDLALLNFVQTGILDDAQLLRYAKEAAERLARQSRAGSFGSAWRVFHDSFADNEDEVCRSLMDGITKNFEIVSVRDVDGVLSVFKRLGRLELADELRVFALKNGSASFWTSDDPFSRGPEDPALKESIVERREASKPVFDFEKDLVDAAQTLNAEKLSQLAKVPVQRYQELFASRTGDELRRVILSALDYRRISNASDDQRAVVSKAEEALKLISNTSPLNAIRIAKYLQD